MMIQYREARQGRPKDTVLLFRLGDFFELFERDAEVGAAILGITLTKRHDLSAPQGVRGRNSDNTRLRQVLGWEPSISLEEGLTTTYRWIESQLVKLGSLAGVAS